MTWFKLMWKNSYIQLFLVAIVMFIYLAFFVIYYSLTEAVITISIPILMMLTIAYKGFYQFWKDYKEGKSR